MKALFALALLSSIAYADPLRLEIGAGACHPQVNIDGYWWQNLHEHDLYLRTFCYAVGASKVWQVADRSYLGLRADYVDLGKASISATWADDAHAKMGGLPATGAGTGWGTSNGVTLGPLYEYRVDPDSAIQLEGGAYILHSVWTEQVNWTPGAIGYTTSWSKSEVTPYGGIGLRWHWFSASVRYYVAPQVAMGLGHSEWQPIIGVSVPIK